MAQKYGGNFTLEEKDYLRELLKKLPLEFWDDEDHAVGGYISRSYLYKLMTE